MLFGAYLIGIDARIEGSRVSVAPASISNCKVSQFPYIIFGDSGVALDRLIAPAIVGDPNCPGHDPVLLSGTQVG
jgi:hypothetical protein